MTAHGAAQLPPGSMSAALPIGNEVQEYEKILKISDQIFSGTHPRLKVPQQFVRKVTSRPPRNPPITQAQVAKDGPSGTSQEKPSESTIAMVGSFQNTASANGPSTAAPPSAPASLRIVPKPISEIDPIFLTKSDDLVRAEIQLQRQRVERALREQLEQRKLESRQKASIQDAKPDFDVSDVLNQALEIVRPISLSEASGRHGAGAPSESFDENSFYSSRAPDSPQHGDQQQPSPASERHAPPSHSEDHAADVPVDHYSDELQRLEALNRSGSDQEMQDSYPVADKPLPHQKQPHSTQVDTVANKLHSNQQQMEAIEEPEYSPPAPDVPPMGRRDSREYHKGLTTSARRRAPDARLSDRNPYARHSISPSRDVRIVRNHITSPAAPRPSRVSPLAVAKVPSVQQLKEVRSDYGSDRTHPQHDSHPTSPDIPAQQLMPRKRRRLQEDRERPRYRRQAVDSSEPYIKEEPVSPPPFADVPSAIRSRHAQEPVYIDIASPRYTPVIDRREPSIREPAYEIDHYARSSDNEMAGEPGMARTLSRLSVRRPMRDDQDLRRVASLHHARLPEYSREYVEPANPRAIRAASYAVVEQPAQERARYYEEPAPAYARRLVPADEPRVSPRYGEAYYEDELPARIMAPPQRRIVVDEHGNQYYETVQPRIQQMPPPPGRIVRGEIYDDRAHLRTSSVRAASIVEDAYGDRRYVPEMPPPPTAYRRVAEYARATPAERRSYVDDRELFPRSGSVQVAEYPTRRTAYVDEHDIPRERLVRMSSVRPPTARYEEPREVIQRVESVRPGGREVSMYVDDGRGREFIERPVYLTARPVREEQYYDNESASMNLDGARDVARRASQRY